MKENYLKKVEKYVKSKGFKGNECLGNEYFLKDILVSNRYMIRKFIKKEDIYLVLVINFKDKLYGKIKE